MAAAAKTTAEKKAAADERAAAETVEATPVDPSQCVVDDGTPHTGRAVNGVVCSRHAIAYHPDGRKRTP